jgi:hypothetical protein
MSTADQATTAPRATTAPTSAAAEPYDITLTVSALEDLFNAPTVNPFVDRDLRGLGEPAVHRAVHELQATGARDRRPVRLRIQAPMTQLTGDTRAPQVIAAIRRYCAAKIADNTQAIALIRRRARRGLEISIVLVLIFAALAYALLTTLLANAGTIIQGIVEGSLSVFAWVVLWDTLEAYLFNPLPASFENRALTRLLSAEIIIEPISAEAEQTGASD